jgi:bacillithiol system protein YtxJ
MANYRELTSLDALEEALQASHQQPVLFFKHSNTCPISAHAFAEFEKYLETEASVGLQHALIVVQKARAVSDRLATLTGVRHETPQAILVQNGKAVWDESHFSLRSTAIAQAVGARA